MRGKGEGSIFEDKQRGTWVTIIELPPDPVTGKRRRKTIRRKGKGDLLNARRDALKDLDRAGDLATSSPTLEQWVTIWLERVLPARKLKPRTLTTYRATMVNYVIPTIGRYRLDKLTTDHIRRVHDHIADKGLSSTTALQAHRILAKCLTDAMREGRISRNVATLVDAPSRAVVKQEALTAEQARTLLAYVGKRMDEGRLDYARWIVPVLTGMRQGEQLGMTRDSLDLENGIITVDWALSRITWEHGCGKADKDGIRPCGKRRGGNCPHRKVHIPAGMEHRQLDGGLWLLRPKSRAGWREVPMEPRLLKAMRHYVQQTDPEDLIFTRDGGRPIDPAQDYHAWQVVLAEAGLPKVKLHSARHTTATLLRYLGVDDDLRIKILGHSSATVTAGYTQLSTEQTREAMDRLGGFLLEA